MKMELIITSNVITWIIIYILYKRLDRKLDRALKMFEVDDVEDTKVPKDEDKTENFHDVSVDECQTERHSDDEDDEYQSEADFRQYPEGFLASQLRHRRYLRSRGDG